MSKQFNLKRWFLIRLFVIPSIISLVFCAVILPLVSALRNLILYNYFPFDTFWSDLPYLLFYGFVPVYLILIPFTALGLWIYVKLKHMT